MLWFSMKYIIKMSIMYMSEFYVMMYISKIIFMLCVIQFHLMKEIDKTDYLFIQGDWK